MKNRNINKINRTTIEEAKEVEKEDKEDYLILYVYDLKYKDKQQYNRLKRRFYYYFNKLLEQTPPGRIERKTKSTIVCYPYTEVYLDELFSLFKEDIVLFKAYLKTDLQQIY